MNTQKYTWLFYFITLTIVATIGVQFYWNFKNYEENKQRVANEIQLSLDNAVEEYYSSLAKTNFVTIVSNSFRNNSLNIFEGNRFKTAIDTSKQKKNKKGSSKVTLNSIKITSDENLSREAIDSIMLSTKKFVTKFNLKEDSSKFSADYLKIKAPHTQFIDSSSGYHFDSKGNKTAVTYFKGKAAADSLRLITNLQPIFISFLDQSIEYKKLDSLIDNQLQTKGIHLKTSFHHIKNDSIFQKTKDTTLTAERFSVDSKSTYLKDGEAFKLYYSNPNFEALKRGFGGILLSFILALLIVSCLFYLLKIIKEQKELSTIKNDLISNITHEFKTPIATVSTAIEAIENFNVLDDKEKTQKYLSLSSIQLKKLHQMVEKLLETATLDSEKLMLKKEATDLVELIEKQVQRHQLLTEKELHFSTNRQPLYVFVDVFHFENVISNLIDNAIKYGGNFIEVNVNTVLNSLEITIADDGNGIEKNQQEKIFDKFYRVPKGNTHDVKGFGIGLYYCKKIVEKHEGIINLQSEKNKTIFKITIPNE